LHQPISKLQELFLGAYRSLNEMRANLDYIQKELTSLNVRQDARHAVAGRCEDFSIWIERTTERMNSSVTDFIETESDRSRQLQTLKDLVEEVRALVNFEIMELYNFACELAPHRQESIDLGILYDIVVKSGDNILSAHTELDETLNVIEKHLSG
jgi:hypothetical protein